MGSHDISEVFNGGYIIELWSQLEDGSLYIIVKSKPDEFVVSIDNCKSIAGGVLHSVVEIVSQLAGLLDLLLLLGTSIGTDIFARGGLVFVRFLERRFPELHSHSTCVVLLPHIHP